jgi:hypothetical protein
VASTIHQSLNGGGSTALKIGAHGADTIACLAYTGYIDDMRIWSSALTQPTISRWMGWELVISTSQWHPNYASLVAHYTFDETSGKAVQVEPIKPVLKVSGTMREMQVESLNTC